jgi:hypothetical protein
VAILSLLEMEQHELLLSHSSQVQGRSGTVLSREI